MLKASGVLILCAAIAAPAASLAITLRGEWNDVYSPSGGGRVRFVGRFDPTSGLVRGRLMCAGSCPVRGRFRPTCTPSSSLGSECQGPVGPTSAGCAASGSVYLKVFEGTWECGPGRGGLLSFGHR